MARAYESKLKALDKRLAAIERAQLKRIYLPIAAEFGMDPDTLLDECETFLKQPLARQLAQVDAIFADWCAEGHDPAEFDVDAIKATLQDPTAEHAARIRVYRPAPEPPTVIQLAWAEQPLPDASPASVRTPRRVPAPAPESEPVDDDDEDVEVDAALAEIITLLQARATDDQTGLAQHLKDLISQLS